MAEHQAGCICMGCENSRDAEIAALRAEVLELANLSMGGGTWLNGKSYIEQIAAIRRGLENREALRAEVQRLTRERDDALAANQELSDAYRLEKQTIMSERRGLLGLVRAELERVTPPKSHLLDMVTAVVEEAERLRQAHAALVAALEMLWEAHGLDCTACEPQVRAALDAARQEVKS